MLVQERQQVVDECVELRHVSLNVILLNLRDQQVEAPFEAGYQEQGHTLCYLRVLIKHVKGCLQATSQFAIFSIRFL